ncbi:radical SAM family heme chaperone HemW [Glaciecola petra]|uniref:Heme chaperone HemW n=1 Tax=Glaciecola petra TaxID=3075602 RepID=A0ABU2ZTE7_9ALTE|nr:radical SAM family heme chaperone HemW [Aestuariibacter sp. P117]MDT0595917.1 radical SAM family heme chaperone HemW [Aestuariibacter sp. P117]
MNGIPLALYIHVPWCVQKCPYCDFNSHQLKGAIPEKEYIAHLLADLEQDIPLITHNGIIREVNSIFIGGGTPSLLSVDAMHTLLHEIGKRIPIAGNAEITMEANPGTVEAAKFIGFKQAGINRISMGIQSFQQQHLSILGRIHDSQQSHNAIGYAKELGLNSFNTDIMHGLPAQSLSNALDDLSQAMSHQPPHISWYQLTIEPNTLFYSKPPSLPPDDLLWDIQTEGQTKLASKGYRQYEVSAYAKEGHQCQHNLNYWRYGDYLGIGCGAHGKITQTNSDTGKNKMGIHKIIRTVKTKHPKGYMNIAKPYLYESSKVEDSDLCFEFFMNRFRLVEPCPIVEFERYTGRALYASELGKLKGLAERDLLIYTDTHWQVSELGKRYLNSLLEVFV